VDEAEAILKEHRADIPEGQVSKLEQAVRAARGGVLRVHIVDGRVEEGLLAEVFSNEGIGTLVHANEYQAIRRAHRKDVRAILALTQQSVENDDTIR
jgi:amino-acid N-acetyltransferase